MSCYHPYDLVGKCPLRTLFVEHIILFQQSFIQEMFTMFQECNPVPFPHRHLRCLTSLLPVACYSTHSQLFTFMDITLSVDESYTTSYLSFKYLIFRLPSPILPSQLFIPSSTLSRPRIHGL